MFIDVTFPDEDEYLYYYDGKGPDIYFRCTHLNQKSDRLDVWDLEETCENIDNGSYADKLSKLGMPEVHTTVTEGVYRFDENGEATCVFLMDEYAEGFSFLWLIEGKEENTLTVIGTKENRIRLKNG